ncbi:beta-lactamase superfamily domain-containing protein [Triangularia setosa]|uniref:Beta-lactamase superfamily domain-containing protein n=1 Tax=Triangularia setosa TaxID=2587417 RepID=A0AAN6W1M4_9PEZI|nr:beta-lactamase superfamily domain-containing protein [Podospora setosa]
MGLWLLGRSPQPEPVGVKTGKARTELYDKSPQQLRIPIEILSRSLLRWHKRAQFCNIHPSWDQHFNGSIFPILFRVLWMKLTGNLPMPNTSSQTIPIQKPSFLPTRQGPNDKLYYLEFQSDIRVLFEPVFEDHCAPTFFGSLLVLGPKRYTPPPCAISDLPTIDIVVISHSHYDNLSALSIKEIKKYHPNAHYFIGLGLGKWFSKMGESIHARLSCFPTQHSSGRIKFNKDTTLWCSWAVSSGSKPAYFAGDTGYRALLLSNPIKPSVDRIPYSSINHLPCCSSFAQIGLLRGPFDVRLIPIGAYKPRQYMSCVHSSPKDAVEISRETRCKNGLGIHWGTWTLTFEEVEETPSVTRQPPAAWITANDTVNCEL